MDSTVQKFTAPPASTTTFHKLVYGKISALTQGPGKAALGVNPGVVPGAKTEAAGCPDGTLVFITISRFQAMNRGRLDAGSQTTHS